MYHSEAKLTCNILFFKTTHSAGAVAQVVELLPNKPGARSLNQGKGKKKKKKKERKNTHIKYFKAKWQKSKSLEVY
jgi:hypothetical protein